jgi:hypothetical protein
VLKLNQLMTTLLYILTATFLVSLTSLLTLFTLAIKKKPTPASVTVSDLSFGRGSAGWCFWTPFA